ncbi:MAG: MFS transporter [Bdellovibrionales bacterium]
MIKNIYRNFDNSKKWISYDWANSVFATSVASAFFPIMLRNYWAKGLPSEDVTLYLGLASSITAAFLTISLPFLGHAIDQIIKKPQRALFLTALIGGGFTSSLFFIKENSPLTALVIYIISFIFFAFGNTQCDGMLLKILKKPSHEELNSLSSKGYLFGYLGGGTLLLLQSLTLVFHKSLGFSSPLLPAKLCFLTAGIWWILFSLPVLSIKNLNTQKVIPENFFKNSWEFLKHLDKNTLFFLAGFFLYIDVVFTMYKMAVDFGLSMGISQNSLIMVLIYVQIIGVPGTLFMNWVAKKYKTQSAIYLGIFCYAVVVTASPFVKTVYSFTFLATFIGIAQGGLQALSRSHFATLIDKSKQGISFGFLNVFGKLSAILGPLVVGVAAKVLKGNTYSVLALLPFLLFSTLFTYLSFKKNPSSRC